jgi:hypothetical protein
MLSVSSIDNLNDRNEHVNETNFETIFLHL